MGRPYASRRQERRPYLCLQHLSKAELMAQGRGQVGILEAETAVE